MDKVTFQAPTVNWGTATHMAIYGPNPKRKWWSFWRPKTALLYHGSLDKPFHIGSEATMKFDSNSLTITED